MTLEVLRVDPEISAPVGEPWPGFGLSTEQRFPVVGDGWQVWSISRATRSPSSRILDGMPVSPPFTTVDMLATWLVLPEQRRLVGGELSYAQAYCWAYLVQVAEASTLVDGRWVMGIPGAVEGFRYWRDVLRVEGRA